MPPTGKWKPGAVHKCILKTCYKQVGGGNFLRKGVRIRPCMRKCRAKFPLPKAEKLKRMRAKAMRKKRIMMWRKKMLAKKALRCVKVLKKAKKCESMTSCKKECETRVEKHMSAMKKMEEGGRTGYGERVHHDE